MKDFQSEAKSHKEKLLQNHRVNKALQTMQSQAERLVSTWMLHLRIGRFAAMRWSGC